MGGGYGGYGAMGGGYGGYGGMNGGMNVRILSLAVARSVPIWPRLST